MGLFRQTKVEVLCRCGHTRRAHFANGSEGKCTALWRSGSRYARMCDCLSWGALAPMADGPGEGYALMVEALQILEKDLDGAGLHEYAVRLRAALAAGGEVLSSRR